MERKWYQQTWAIIASLWLFFPAGLYLMWRYASWRNGWKWGVTGIAAALVALTALGAALPAEDPLAGLTPEQVVSVHATATQEALEEAVARQTAEAPEPTEMPKLTETPKPTETPRLTETPKPTETSEPTETPKPITPQGPPELTTAECAYLETLTRQSEDLGDALARFGELFSAPQLFSDVWTLSVAVQLVIIQVTYNEASALDPPASLQAVHTAYMSGMSKLNDATFLIAEGIGNLDPDQLLEAADLMMEGTEDIGRTTELILEFGATRSGSC